MSGNTEADCLISDKNSQGDRKKGGGAKAPELTIGRVVFIKFDSSKRPSVNMSGKNDADYLILHESAMPTNERA